MPLVYSRQNHHDVNGDYDVLECFAMISGKVNIKRIWLGDESHRSAFSFDKAATVVHPQKPL